MSNVEETFVSHLVELRDRLLRALIAVIVIFVVLMPWAGDIYDLLALPMMKTLPEGTSMIATGVVTPFFVPVKVTMLMAFVLALPYVLHQAWGFIAPGLYSHEKRMGLPLVVGTTLLFLAGMAFCYFFVFQTVFRFIYEFAPDSIVVAPDIEQYLSFVMTLFIAFGMTFEVPVVVILLAKVGVVDVQKLREARPYIIVGAFIIAAVVTPPDVISQFMLAVPMIVLYEVGILLVKFMGTKKTDEEHDDELDPALQDSSTDSPRIEDSTENR